MGPDFVRYYSKYDYDSESKQRRSGRLQVNTAVLMEEMANKIASENMKFRASLNFNASCGNDNTAKIQNTIKLSNADQQDTSYTSTLGVLGNNITDEKKYEGDNSTKTRTANVKLGYGNNYLVVAKGPNYNQNGIGFGNNNTNAGYDEKIYNNGRTERNTYLNIYDWGGRVTGDLDDKGVSLGIEVKSKVARIINAKVGIGAGLDNHGNVNNATVRAGGSVSALGCEVGLSGELGFKAQDSEEAKYYLKFMYENGFDLQTAKEILENKTYKMGEGYVQGARDIVYNIIQHDMKDKDINRNSSVKDMYEKYKKENLQGAYIIKYSNGQTESLNLKDPKVIASILSSKANEEAFKNSDSIGNKSLKEYKENVENFVKNNYDYSKVVTNKYLEEHSGKWNDFRNGKINGLRNRKEHIEQISKYISINTSTTTRQQINPTQDMEMPSMK